MTPSDERGFASTSDGKTADRGQVFKVEPMPKDFKPTGGPLALVPEKQFLEMKVDRDRLAERVESEVKTHKELAGIVGQLHVENAALTQRLAGMEEILKTIANITDGHPIDADRRDRIHALAQQALGGRNIDHEYLSGDSLLDHHSRRH